MADVLVVSHYQAECNEARCDWTGVMRSDYADSRRDAENHDAAHRLREAEAARLTAKWRRETAAARV